MPLVLTNIRKKLALSIATAGIAVACTAGPAAAASATNPTGCTVGGTVSNPFTAWQDLANYELSPGGDFESAATGWTLNGGAGVVSGNQPFNIGTSGSRSLEIASGGSAVSAPMCIDRTYPSFRFFARNTGSAKSALKVEVLYINAKGGVAPAASGNVVTKTTSWFATTSLKIGISFDPTAVGGAAPVAFRFTPQGPGGVWTIDDVYVDPFARR